MWADPKNVVTLARAALQRGEKEPQPYTNFEMRDQAKLKRMGLTSDMPVPLAGPVHLRLSRKGAEIEAAVSIDGKEWKDLKGMELPAHWPDRLFVGVAGISTSMHEFAPEFSNLKLVRE